MKHSSGPWKAVGNRIKGSKHGKFVAQVFSQHVPGIISGIAEEKANAQLIATAPELLGALKDAISWLTDVLPKNPVGIERLEDIVRKAEGK